MYLFYKIYFAINCHFRIKYLHHCDDFHQQVIFKSLIATICVMHSIGAEVFISILDTKSRYLGPGNTNILLPDTGLWSLNNRQDK